MSGPDTRHADYEKQAPQWERCRDVIAGEDAVHAKREAYLPRLSGQEDSEYYAYVKRAPFYGATARTVDGLVGMVLRKEPVVEAPASMDAIRADMTLSGTSLETLSEHMLREVTTVGRIGVLVEYPVQVEGPMTLAQAAAMNRRAYASVFHAEHIINWRVARVNNAMQPVMVTLTEKVEEWANEFEMGEVDQRRALLLEQTPDGWRYLQRLYRKAEKSGTWEQVGGDIVPLMNGQPLGFIPFVITGPQGNTFSCQKPPIYDLATLNLSHYRTIADYEHGAHFTGLPTPFIAGVQLAEGETIRIGSSQAITSPDPQAKGTFMEFTGQGLSTLKDRAAEKEAQMAAIGARMLAPEKAGVEAEGTLAMRHSGESAVLATIAKMVSAGLTRILQIMADWEGVASQVRVTMNTDFADLSLTAQEIDALVSAWQRGAISRETMFDNFKRGEIIPEGRDFETEAAAIEDQAPTMAVDPLTGEPVQPVEPGADPAGQSAAQPASQPAEPVDFGPLLSALEGMPATVASAVQAVLKDLPAPVVNVAAPEPVPPAPPPPASPDVNVSIPAMELPEWLRPLLEKMAKDEPKPTNKRLSITAPSGAVYEGEITEK